MAFSALRQCKPSMQSSLYIRSLASATTPKLAASPAGRQEPAKVGMFKQFTSGLGHAAAPIGVMGAMVVVALMIGAHTVTQQFVRSPSVQVTKKNRECMPEVDQPDATIQSGDKFVNKSFLRKVAHLQDKQYGDQTGPNIYTRSRQSDTLQTVGVIGKD